MVLEVEPFGGYADSGVDYTISPAFDKITSKVFYLAASHFQPQATASRLVD
jgi:hypothetical protein